MTYVERNLILFNSLDTGNFSNRKLPDIRVNAVDKLEGNKLILYLHNMNTCMRVDLAKWNKLLKASATSVILRQSCSRHRMDAIS